MPHDEMESPSGHGDIFFSQYLMFILHKRHLLSCEVKFRSAQFLPFIESALSALSKLGRAAYFALTRAWKAFPTLNLSLNLSLIDKMTNLTLFSGSFTDYFGLQGIFRLPSEDTREGRGELLNLSCE